MIVPSVALGKVIHARHKYGAQRTVCLLGHKHDSKKEAEWCQALHRLQKEGKLFLLCRQPKFELHVNKILVAVHRPDFSYYAWTIIAYESQHLGGPSKPLYGLRRCIVEVKGNWVGGRLPVWKLKHALFTALYPDVEYQVV